MTRSRARAKQALRSIFRHVAPPLPIENAGHFIQEDAGERVAEEIMKWMSRAAIEGQASARC